MYLQYPLEALVRRRGNANQLEFARAAQRAMPRARQAVLHPLDRGLAIFAANEAALEEPKRVLREAYGDLVEMRDPRVRYLPGTPLREPIMQIRITARRAHADALLAELRQRGAQLLDESLLTRVYVLRAEAPLAALLGLPARIDAITAGQGMYWIWLARYGEVPPPEGPEAA
jgi:hypothetical protein